MWNKSQVLLVKVRTGNEHGHHRPSRFTIPLSLFALQELLDAWEPLIRFFTPGHRAAREWKHMGVAYLEIGGRFLRELRSYGRLDLVDVETRDGDKVKIALY